MRRWSLLCFLVLPALAQAAPVRVVAAESVYANIARQIAGPGAAISAIISNPAQDPHLFEPGPDAARALGSARIIIYNGAGYDPWMRPLLAATGSGAARRVIDMADLLRVGAGANPHLWYNPDAAPALAYAVAAALTALDPAGRATYAANLAAFLQAAGRVQARVARLRAAHAGAAVVATEPVFNPMLDALGLKTLDPAFEIAAENSTEPAAAAVAVLEDDLRHHAARVLLRNSQTEDSLTRRMVAVARAAGVPVVAVSETEPPGLDWQHWLGTELDALDQALGGTTK